MTEDVTMTIPGLSLLLEVVSKRSKGDRERDEFRHRDRFVHPTRASPWLAPRRSRRRGEQAIRFVTRGGGRERHYCSRFVRFSSIEERAALPPALRVTE